MILTLDAGGPIIATIDLGEAIPNYFEEGDLGSTAGNLYLGLDGKEYGSLFFYRENDGTVTITLGAFDFAKQEWDEKNPLTAPVQTEESKS